jgi:hypothetical protein
MVQEAKIQMQVSVTLHVPYLIFVPPCDPMLSHEPTLIMFGKAHAIIVLQFLPTFQAPTFIF